MWYGERKYNCFLMLEEWSAALTKDDIQKTKYHELYPDNVENKQLAICKVLFSFASAATMVRGSFCFPEIWIFCLLSLLNTSCFLLLISISFRKLNVIGWCAYPYGLLITKSPLSGVPLGCARNKCKQETGGFLKHPINGTVVPGEMVVSKTPN